MAKDFVPGDLFGLWLRSTQTMFEANMVLSLRLMGLFGLWRVGRGDDARAPAETPPSPAAPGPVVPPGRTTRSNVRRLPRRGPRLP